MMAITIAIKKKIDVMDNKILLGSFSGIPKTNKNKIGIRMIDMTNIIKFFLSDLDFKFITYSPNC